MSQAIRLFRHDGSAHQSQRLEESLPTNSSVWSRLRIVCREMLAFARGEYRSGRRPDFYLFTAPSTPYRSSVTTCDPTSPLTFPACCGVETNTSANTPYRTS